MNRLPSPGLLLVTAVSLVLFFGLPILGWGSLSGLALAPGAGGGFLVVGLACVGLAVHRHQPGRMRPGRREGSLDACAPCRRSACGSPSSPPTTTATTWPPLTATRPVTSAWPCWSSAPAPGRADVRPGARFTWPLASQEAHALMTTGFYRFVRHPSYLGGHSSAGSAGCWSSGAGSACILMALLIPAFLPGRPGRGGAADGGVRRGISSLPPTDLAAGPVRLLREDRD